jgi:hypothetical protein
MEGGGHCRFAGKIQQGGAMIHPAFRPLRPVLCRERRGHQGQTLTGRFAGLDPRAFLPAMNTCGRGTETPPGACSRNTLQRQNPESQNLDVTGLHGTITCKSCKNSLKIVFAAFCRSTDRLEGFYARKRSFWAFFQGIRSCLPAAPFHTGEEITVSFLVLHMDKFKKEAIRGIQSHNLRERRSHSNPDIEYERSSGNYELHEGVSRDYASAVQNRIDDLLLVKTVRRDAVHLCGLIVSSDSAFFKDLSPEESRRFFEESKKFLTQFVGEENVISAMVHMDEKTPHMHFLHVPVTKDGRLNANEIYTRDSLKSLQTELPQYLRDRGFVIQRGIEQEAGSKKKHLDTREFKQQQNALDRARRGMGMGR